MYLTPPCIRVMYKANLEIKTSEKENSFISKNIPKADDLIVGPRYQEVVVAKGQSQLTIHVLVDVTNVPLEHRQLSPAPTAENSDHPVPTGRRENSPVLPKCDAADSRIRQRNPPGLGHGPRFQIDLDNGHFRIWGTDNSLSL